MEIPGFKFSTTCAGIKGKDRPDMVLVVSDPPARWSGMFTTNRVKAAPVILGMARLKKGAPLSAVLINSGNANACNGDRGMADALALCRETARLLGVPEDQVVVASTGVIGQPLPMGKMLSALPTLTEKAGQASLKDVATAIMTTDRYPKWAREDLPGFSGIKIGGVAKGAGMIHPDMATMLGFFFTNAGVPSESLHEMTKQAVASFNQISVDGDQSTNDTVLVLDNGPVREDEALLRVVRERLETMMSSLAYQIVDNGEGVTKVVTLYVEGAETPEDARRIAESVGTSPLVKTAFFGEDPNWGRIMAAIGYAGAEIDPGRIGVAFNDVLLVVNGQWAGAAAEKRAEEVMKARNFAIRIVLGVGRGAARLVTSDLSVDYIKINAEYRS